MKLRGKKEWGGEIIFCQGQRNSKGVMILINTFSLSDCANSQE